MDAAEGIFFLVRIWGTIGAIVAAVFLTIGIDRIDEDARGSYAFRPLIVPGILLLWPLVLWRWFVLEREIDVWKKRYRAPRDAHVWVSLSMVIAIPLIIIIGLSQKQIWPADFTPERISAPSEVGQ